MNVINGTYVQLPVDINWDNSSILSLSVETMNGINYESLSTIVEINSLSNDLILYDQNPNFAVIPFHYLPLTH